MSSEGNITARVSSRIRISNEEKKDTKNNRKQEIRRNKNGIIE